MRLTDCVRVISHTGSGCSSMMCGTAVDTNEEITYDRMKIRFYRAAIWACGLLTSALGCPDTDESVSFMGWIYKADMANNSNRFDCHTFNIGAWAVITENKARAHVRGTLSNLNSFELEQISSVGQNIGRMAENWPLRAKRKLFQNRFSQFRRYRLLYINDSYIISHSRTAFAEVRHEIIIWSNRPNRNGSQFGERHTLFCALILSINSFRTSMINLRLTVINWNKMLKFAIATEILNLAPPTRNLCPFAFALYSSWPPFAIFDVFSFMVLHFYICLTHITLI